MFGSDGLIELSGFSVYPIIRQKKNNHASMQQYSNWQGPHRVPARLWYPQVLGEKLRRSLDSMQVLKVRLLYSVAYITDSIIDHDTLANGYDCRHLSNELELWSEADVLEFAIHLVFCTHITPEHFANVSQHTSLQRMHSIFTQYLSHVLIVTINHYI